LVSQELPNQVPSFSYKALSDGGKTITGVVTAENYQVALRMLEEQALFPIRVSEGADHGAQRTVWGRRVKARDLTTFYSQLADLLRAGVPMLRSLDVLSRQDGRGSQGVLVQVVKELRESVAGGTSLGDAMGKHPAIFSPLHASMVRAGEQGGFLEEVLGRIAIFSEKQDELRNKVVGSMIYPAILVVAGGLVLSLVMLFVVPMIRPYLREETFNIFTRVVFAISDTVKVQWKIILGVLVVVLIGLNTAIKTDAGKACLDKLKLKAPLLGNILTMVAICRFCRILGTMLHNGVPILQALKISKDSAGNDVLAAVIEKAGDSVKKGAALSEPLGASGLFPATVVDMISVAEESNNLENVLVQIAETNEVRTARQIDLAVRVLEPVLLVIMALAVFCILLGILLPILTMGSAAM